MQVMLLLSHHAQHMEHVRGEGMVGELEKPEAKGTAGERGRERQSGGKAFSARAIVHGEGNRGLLHRPG